MVHVASALDAWIVVAHTYPAHALKSRASTESGS